MMAANMSAPTYEDIIQYHGLSSSQVQEVVPDDVLHSLAKKMTRWQSIAVDLKVDAVVAEAIEKEKIDEEGKGRKLLERWKEGFGHAATFELLTSCLIKSKRVDLAGLVCGECKKCVPCPNVSSESVVPPAPTECHIFTTQAIGEEGQSDSRDIPIKRQEVETVGAHQTGPLRESTDMATSEQEKSNGCQSDMVTPKTATSLPASDPQVKPPESPTTPSHDAKMLNVVTDSLAHMDKLTLLIISEKEDRKILEGHLDKKTHKMRELKERKRKVEDCLSDKDKEIDRLEKEAENMKCKLSREQDKRWEVQVDLTKKEKKIHTLQDDISQKDQELKEVREDRQEKCKKLAELEKQLNEAHDKLLEAENDAKDDMEKQLTEVSERYDELQREIKKADDEVDTTRKERETLEDVLRWTAEDLEEEEEEENEIATLKYKLERQKKLTKTYRRVIIFLLFLLASILLI